MECSRNAISEKENLFPITPVSFSIQKKIQSFSIIKRKKKGNMSINFKFRCFIYINPLRNVNNTHWWFDMARRKIKNMNCFLFSLDMPSIETWFVCLTIPPKLFKSMFRSNTGMWRHSGQHLVTSSTTASPNQKLDMPKFIIQDLGWSCEYFFSSFLTKFLA